MAHYGLLRNYKFDNTTARDDIRGTKIYGRNDEKLGTIEAHCRLGQGPATVVPLTLLPPV